VDPRAIVRPEGLCQIRCRLHVKLNTGLPWKKTDFKKKTLFTSKLDLNLRKELVKCYNLSTVLCGVETETMRKVDHKYMESSKLCCWKRM
jgi:hypothetical protein